MRIDKYVADKFRSRTQAAEAVEKGLVTVNGKPVAPSYEVKDGDKIEISRPEVSFVSAGGYKLDKALREFGFSVKDKVFADIGASTGGFTDCLFQHGAKKVYCIDVGESQLDESLKDKNIVVIDKFNARNIEKSLFCEVLCGVVIDVSFISLTYILGGVSYVLEAGASVLALIKPQFECDCKNVGKNGVVRDKNIRLRAINKIYDFAAGCDLAPVQLCNAPIVAGKNLEYVIRLEKGGKAVDRRELLKSVKL